MIHIKNGGPFRYCLFFAMFSNYARRVKLSEILSFPPTKSQSDISDLYQILLIR